MKLNKLFIYAIVFSARLPVKEKLKYNTSFIFPLFLCQLHNAFHISESPAPCFYHIWRFPAYWCVLPLSFPLFSFSVLTIFWYLARGTFEAMLYSLLNCVKLEEVIVYLCVHVVVKCAFSPLLVLLFLSATHVSCYAILLPVGDKFTIYCMLFEW